MSSRKRRLPFIAACAAALMMVSGMPASAELPGGGGGEEDDTTAPVIRVQAPEGAWQGWYREPATIKISATDTGGSGLQNLTWTITGAQPGSGGGNNVSVVISTQGVSEFAITATDFEGNTSTAKYGVGIDTLAPQITLGGTATDNMVVERGAKRTITYSCTDNLTGVDLCTGDFVTGAEVPTDTLGQKKVEMRALDKVQNRSTKTINYTVVESALQVAMLPQMGGFSTTPRVGDTLTVTGGTFTPAADSVGYRWLRDGAPVGTGASYTLTEDDHGAQMAVVAVGHKAGFAEGIGQTIPTAQVGDGHFSILTYPELSGTAEVGSQLRLTPPVTSPVATSVSHRWFRSGVPIPGATGTTYTLTAADVGHQVSAESELRRTKHTTRLVFPNFPSGPVRARVLSVTQVPKVSGTARVGRTLTATTPTFTPAAESVAWQWLRNGVAISGATRSTYKLTSYDVGRQISARVVGRRAQYADTPATSVATGKAAKALSSVSSSVRALGKKRVRVTVAVRATGFTPSGRVTIKYGSKVVARNKLLKGGRFTVTLSRQKKGTARYTVVYTGSGSSEARAIHTAKVRVR